MNACEHVAKVAGVMQHAGNTRVGGGGSKRACEHKAVLQLETLCGERTNLRECGDQLLNALHVKYG
eukprot:5164313-Pyramimonas_sp.AAC.1